MDQKMLIQMYTHEHWIVYRIRQSAIKIHQATTKPRKQFIQLKKPNKVMNL